MPPSHLCACGTGALLRQSSVSSDADVLAAVNVDRYPDGSAVVLKAVFGNSLTYDDSGDVSGATALTQVCFGFRITCVFVGMFGRGFRKEK